MNLNEQARRLEACWQVKKKRRKTETVCVRACVCGRVYGKEKDQGGKKRKGTGGWVFT